MDWDEREDGLDYTEAIEIAIAALRPVSREQVEKLRGEWVVSHDEYNDTTIAKCSKCDEVDVIEFFIEAKDLVPFCPFCGSPMTDKAVDILLRRLEAMYDDTGD